MHVLVSTSTRPASAHIPGAAVAHLRPNLLVATRAELIAGSLPNDEIRAKARRRLRQECVAQSSRVRVAETIIWRSLVLGAVFLANVNSQWAAAVAEVRLHRDVRSGHSCRRVEGGIVQVLVRPRMLNTRGGLVFFKMIQIQIIHVF